MEVDKLYLWDIDENEGLGVFRISQVLTPAMESEFLAFSNELVIEPKTGETESEFMGRCMGIEAGKYPEDQALAICKSKWESSNLSKQTYKFSIDEEKMRVIGAILIPNKKFWRSDIDGWAMFSKDAVEKARTTFKKNNNMFSVNVEHSDSGAPAFLLEDWIVEDSEGDKSKSKFGLSYEVGTWVGVMQITDKNYWNDFIKSGKVKGFSIELDKESVVQKKLLSMEKKNIEKLGEATLKDGTLVYWEGETLSVGMGLFIDAELTQPAPDGEHVDGSGNTIITRDGLVVEIIEAPAEEASAQKASEEVKEFALKSEMTSLISELTARIEKLEAELVKKNEELSKEVKELKSNTPGGKSFVFKKDSKKVEELKADKVEKYSDRLKKTFKELGKL